MIEATQPVSKKAAQETAEARAAAMVTHEEERQDAASAAAAQAVMKAETRKEAPPPNPSFDVQLDAETLKVYSEMRDPETDRVIIRIPAGYDPEAAQPEPPAVAVSKAV